MPSKKGGAPVPKSTSSFFPLPGVTHRVVRYRRSAAIFTQGAECAEVMYLQHGSVKLCVLSPGGKEAIVSVLQRYLPFHPAGGSHSANSISESFVGRMNSFDYTCA